jgi:putative peptidoglycan lipid II flippase
MLVTPVIFGLSAIATSVLNSFKSFIAIALAPVFYNIGIIIGILFLEPKYGIEGVTYGVIIGTALHLIIQLPSLIKVGWRPSWSLDLSHPRLRKMGSMVVPRILSMSASQVNLVINTSIASSFVVGSVTILNLAINLQSLPVGVIGLSVAVATFSTLSEIASTGDFDRFAERIMLTIRMILFLIIPAAAGMIQLRTELVRLILGSGKFNWTDTVLTADTLGYFSIGLFAFALLPLLSRAFYALEDTYSPLKISLFSVVLNLAGAYIFGVVMDMGVMGLGLAFSLVNIFQVTFLYLLLNQKIEWRFKNADLLYSVLKIGFATFVMMAFVQLAKWQIGVRVDMNTGLGVSLKTFGSSAIGIGSYIFAAHLVGCHEVKELISKFRKR